MSIGVTVSSGASGAVGVDAHCRVYVLVELKFTPSGAYGLVVVGDYLESVVGAVLEEGAVPVFITLAAASHGGNSTVLVTLGIIDILRGDNFLRAGRGLCVRASHSGSLQYAKGDLGYLSRANGGRGGPTVRRWVLKLWPASHWFPVTRSQFQVPDPNRVASRLRPAHPTIGIGRLYR